MGYKYKPFRFPQPSDWQREKDRRRATLALGRPIERPNVVHHHSLTQLVICQDTAFHRLLHRRTITYRLGYDPNVVMVCMRCQKPYPINDFTHSSGGDGLHSLCKSCGYYRPDMVALRDSA